MLNKRIVVLFAGILIFCFNSMVFAEDAVRVKQEGKVGLGVVAGGLPVVKYYLNETFAGEVGLSISSGTSNSTTLLLRGFNDVVFGKKFKVHVGGGLVYQNAASVTTTTLQGVVGAELFILPNFSLNIDVTALSYANQSGGSTLTLLSGTNNVISSFQIYLD